MRTLLMTLVAGVLMGTSGCKALEGYLFKAEHFKMGTVKEQNFNKSVDKMFATTQHVLRDRGFSIRKTEMPNQEEAQIWASKDGIEYVVDIEAVGEGTKVHLEIDQAGNDGEMWAILTTLEQYP